MIPLVDNLSYIGCLPNFDRDNMTWEEMENQTPDTLDIGHIVYCISEDKKGHWIFLGIINEVVAWKQVIDGSGSIISTTNTYTENITNGEEKIAIINKDTHKCGNYPDITVFYRGEVVFPDIEISSGNITISWGNVDITEETPLIVKLTGK